MLLSKIWKCTVGLAICSASSLGSAAPALAQASAAEQAGALAWFTNATRAVTVGFKRVYCPPLRPAIRRICEQTPIVVRSSWGIGAFAERTPQGARIVLTSGMAAMFDAVAQSEIISATVTGGTQCFEDWANAYFRRMAANTARTEQGLAPRPAQGIVEFAPSSPACRGVNQRSAALAMQRHGTDYARAVEAGLALILLHELGHIVRGHTQNPNPTDEQSRRAELEADDFIVPAATGAGQLLLYSFGPWFMLAVQGDSLKWEKNSTHPLGVRRALRIFSQYSAALASERNYVELPRSAKQEALSDARRLVNLLRPCLASIDRGRPCRLD